MPETTDEELYTRYKTGDDDSFTKLYIRHKAAVRGWLSKSLADSYYCDIHDLVQGVFLDLSQRTPVFTNGSLENWLIQIAVRDATDHLRLKTAKKRYTGWPESEIRDTDRITKVTPLDSLCTKESQKCLRAWLSGYRRSSKALFVCSWTEPLRARSPELWVFPRVISSLVSTTLCVC